MIILGCIKHISNLAVQVEFPGLTFATVPINNISDAFTTSLTEALKTKHDFVSQFSLVYLNFKGYILFLVLY